jgi:hypothetical protein
MAIDAFVPLPADGGRGNDGTGAKPSGRTARPARPMMRAVVRMAAEVAEAAALPIRWLWKDQLALGKIAVVAGASNVGKSLLVTGDFVVRVSVGVAWPDGSPCQVGDDDRNDADVEKMTEDRKFRFCSNNRGGNLSKRVKNRTGVGEKGTSELCPDRRGKFEVRRALGRSPSFRLHDPGYRSMFTTHRDAALREASVASCSPSMTSTPSSRTCAPTGRAHWRNAAGSHAPDRA